LRKYTDLGHGLPRVLRLGLATRGGSHLRAEDVHYAIERGVNYLNWCWRRDGLAKAIAQLGPLRRRVAVAVQLEARTAAEARIEFGGFLDQLGTDYLDIVTLYYVEAAEEWTRITARGGAWHFLNEQKRAGRLRMIGLTSHQRPLAARWAATGRLDLLMIRYNAAHRGAEGDVFPVTEERGIPAVTFTGLRWKALLAATPADPPGFLPPSAADCYRFGLANPRVAVALAAPGNRQELDHALSLLEDWRAPGKEELAALIAHGDRVHRSAGVFW